MQSELRDKRYYQLKLNLPGTMEVQFCNPVSNKCKTVVRSGGGGHPANPVIVAANGANVENCARVTSTPDDAARRERGGSGVGTGRSDPFVMSHPHTRLMLGAPVQARKLDGGLSDTMLIFPDPQRTARSRPLGRDQSCQF